MSTIFLKPRKKFLLRGPIYFNQRVRKFGNQQKKGQKNIFIALKSRNSLLFPDYPTIQLKMISHVHWVLHDNSMGDYNTVNDLYQCYHKGMMKWIMKYMSAESNSEYTPKESIRFEFWQVSTQNLGHAGPTTHYGWHLSQMCWCISVCITIYSDTSWKKLSVFALALPDIYWSITICRDKYW